MNNSLPFSGFSVLTFFIPYDRVQLDTLANENKSRIYSVSSYVISHLCLQFFIISANSLRSVGDFLDITILVSIVDTKTATLSLLFDGNTLQTLGPSAAGPNALISFKLRAIRVNATDLFCYILVGDRAAMTPSIALNSWSGVSVTAFTSDFLFQLRGESTVGPANNDIVATWGIVELNQS